jgi:hypothetical protein
MSALLTGATAPPPKLRRPTKPSRAARERRLADKQHRSEIKRLRRPADECGPGQVAAPKHPASMIDVPKGG